ncbi:sugar diacid recognition domain-containing protein [Pseudomonas moorei]|uniref:Transcriptional regulator, CdaR family n=1 Tax=Pseudomonas moorei TaxID=395599 RepID=A0A1H1I492_9PSED|nr:sugar diacid recognition domain-containing protein [Pseudomonas moorei]KAB0493926.1 CdaR family transcriptional regulator [Pseudomonas moorei]SDR32527.1 transcriptional regulator, CdaR family [Pseudomonas moorei]
MFELDHELAQKIVDRALAILPCNVNVMDSQGLILGSGETERINTRHEGAQLVLANQRVVEIDEHSALSLKGVQPGINVPLMHDERLIGVLGLTGDPQALRTYAELLRMTAEMLVSQRHREGERQWREQRTDDLLGLLLSNTGNSQRLLEEAEQLGLKPYLTRTPVLIELSSELDVTAVCEWLFARVSDSWCLCLSTHTLLWCYPSQSMVDPSKFLQKIEKQGWPILRMAVGVPAQGIEPLRNVCRRVTALAGYGRAVKQGEKYLLLTRYRLPTMLWTHREDDAVGELLAIIDKVQSKDNNGQLIQTLRSWCEHSGQIQSCAEALGVHRNSLRYRMDRIAEITGMDLNKLEDVIELYFGIQLLPHFVTCLCE